MNKEIVKSENKKWKKFKFIEIFDIKSGFYNKKPEVEENGNIPFIGAVDNLNGITEFYTLENIEKSSKTGDKNNHSIDKKIFRKNAICVTNNGSVGYAYYQNSDFTCSHDVNPLYLKKYELNNEIAQFLITAIEQQRVCFEYSRKWRPKRMIKSHIMLPIDKNSEPDYKYMEQYIKSIRQIKLEKYETYIKKQLKEIQYKKVQKLEEKEWKEFFIEELFNIRIGKNIDGNKINKQGGKIPYVTRKENCNGVNGFISYSQDFLTVDYPVITIGNETAEPFIQKYPFFTGTKVNILKPKQKVSEYTLKFIATSLKAHKSKYSYSFTINSTRLKRQKIMLPVNQNLEPDYEYMEQYIKNITYKKLSNYLNYKKLL